MSLLHLIFVIQILFLREDKELFNASREAALFSHFNSFKRKILPLETAAFGDCNV